MVYRLSQKLKDLPHIFLRFPFMGVFITWPTMSRKGQGASVCPSAHADDDRGQDPLCLSTIVALCPKQPTIYPGVPITVFTFSLKLNPERLKSYPHWIETLSGRICVSGCCWNMQRCTFPDWQMLSHYLADLAIYWFGSESQHIWMQNLCSWALVQWLMCTCVWPVVCSVK